MESYWKSFVDIFGRVQVLCLDNPSVTTAL